MENAIVQFLTDIFRIGDVRQGLTEAYGDNAAETIVSIVADAIVTGEIHTSSPRATPDVELYGETLEVAEDEYEPPVDMPVKKKKKGPSVEERENPYEEPLVLSEEEESEPLPEAPKPVVKPKKKTKVTKPMDTIVEEIAIEKPVRKKKPTSNNPLDKMTIVQLKERCKQLGIKPVGNKQSLLNKIKEFEDPREGQSSAGHHESEGSEIEIVQDEQNLYVHPASGLVFDPNAKVAVAWKDPEGNVLPLTGEHIELCVEYGFEYRNCFED